jgi:hypothetical protein
VAETLVAAEAVEEPTSGMTVAESVRSHFQGSDFARLPEHFSPLEKADENMQRHIAEVFEHKLGNLAAYTPQQPAIDMSVAPTAEGVPLAASIAGLLATPEGFRQAIVMREILDRPIDRW